MAVVPHQLTQVLDNLFTTTWYHQLSTIRDQIFDATPFWFWMRDKGRLKTQAGGRFILVPLQYAKNEVVWGKKGTAVSLNDFEFLTNAQWNWRYQIGSMVRFGVDDQQNRGKMQVINYANSKVTNTRNALADDLESVLAGGDGSAFDPPKIDGLQHLVADDPTASATVGGITQNDNTWWRNKTKDMTGSSFASNGVSEMRTMLNNVSNNLGSNMPDIIVSGQTPFEYYEDLIFDSHYRVTNNRLADAGFATQAFKGIPMIWSPAISNQRMYFLNTDFLEFKYDPIMFFDMTEWKPIPDQVNDRAAQVITACTFTVSRRRAQGVIHTIDTA